MAKPMTKVSRAIQGEIFSKIISYREDGEGFLCLMVRTLGAMINSCEMEMASNSATRTSFVRTMGDQLKKGSEKDTCLGSRIVPVMINTPTAPQTNVRKRRAAWINHCRAFAGSGSALTSGTKTVERNSMPPTHSVAARR